MSKKNLENNHVDPDDDDDDEEDDDYCPIKNDNEQSDQSEESEHDGDDVDEVTGNEQTDNKKQNDLNIAPYDASKTDELWRSFTSTTKASSVTTKDNPTPPPPTTTEKQTPKPIATKIFEFAGEKVSVPVTATPPTASPSLKRPAPASTTSTSVLDRLGIGKKQKLSTLEKSRLDWSAHKETEALTEDLDLHRRGKDSYVEKKAFLQRTEARQHDHYLTNIKKK